MTVFLNDPDVTLYHGDVLDVLRQLPDESVDCVVTSPPYWGLRDYGTGEWEGGDPDCDHMQKVGGTGASTLGAASGGNDMSDEARERSTTRSYVAYRDECGKCGARRVDRQMGLEPTPDLFVQNMVEVFREVRRVLADHGTCWVNLGDAFLDKQLVGAPWRVAFALQADGWYLRSDIIWAKPNPMPESVTDRPTKSHEYVFLLTKRPRYWFDTEAVREPHTSTRWGGETITQPPTTKYAEATAEGFNGAAEALSRPGREWNAYPNGGRNVRSVWNIATQPYPEAHFATFPEELARRCIVAGCPTRVCRVCGKPSERIVDTSYEKSPVHGAGSVVGRHYETGANNFDGAGMPRLNKVTETVGWSDCGHNNWRPGLVLDPFMGSGTVAKVARDHQRHAIGIDLNRSYLELAARRLQQLSLLAEA